MSWTSRRKPLADREPSGRIRKRKKPAPRAQPHRGTLGDNPLAATVHGRYLLRKAISAPQHAAGEIFSKQRIRYRAAIGSPDSLRSRSERHGEPSDEDDAEIVRRFEEVRAALGRLYVDVEFVVCLDCMLADLTAYRAGLDKLIKIYGLKQEK